MLFQFVRFAAEICRINHLQNCGRPPSSIFYVRHSRLSYIKWWYLQRPVRTPYPLLKVAKFSNMNTSKTRRFMRIMSHSIRLAAANRTRMRFIAEQCDPVITHCDYRAKCHLLSTQCYAQPSRKICVRTCGHTCDALGSRRYVRHRLAVGTWLSFTFITVLNSITLSLNTRAWWRRSKVKSYHSGHSIVIQYISWACHLLLTNSFLKWPRAFVPLSIKCEFILN